MPIWASLLIMFLLEWTMALTANGVVVGTLFLYVEWKELEANWGAALQTRKHHATNDWFAANSAICDELDAGEELHECQQDPLLFNMWKKSDISDVEL